MDNQQGPTRERREFCSMLCGSLDGRGDWGRMDSCICVAESLCIFFSQKRFLGIRRGAEFQSSWLVLPKQWAFHVAFSSVLALPTKHLNLTPEMPCASSPTMPVRPDETGLTALIPPKKSANIPRAVPQPATRPQQVSPDESPAQLSLTARFQVGAAIAYQHLELSRED